MEGGLTHMKTDKLSKIFVIGIYVLCTIIYICIAMYPVLILAHEQEASTKENLIVSDDDKIDIYVYSDAMMYAQPCEENLALSPAVAESESELELLALVTLAEAEGESELGKRLVIDTVLNRVDNASFPDTISEVIYQKNQFTSMHNGRCDRVIVNDDTRELVKQELLKRTNTDVLYFTAGEYGKYGTHLFKEGNHYFCKE